MSSASFKHIRSEDGRVNIQSDSAVVRTAVADGKVEIMIGEPHIPGHTRLVCTPEAGFAIAADIYNAACAATEKGD